MATPGARVQPVQAQRRTSLFVYGTLKDPALVLALTGRRLRRRAATLKGYRKVLQAASYPYVIPDPNASVDGFILRDVDDDILRILDRYEEEGRLYRRTDVVVTVAGKAEPAMTYVGLQAQRTAR